MLRKLLALKNGYTSTYNLIMKNSLLLALLLLSGCLNTLGEDSGGNDNSGGAVESPVLEFVPSPSPVDFTSTVTFAKDIKYDEHTRNALDIFMPESAEKTPLVIYFHGGGFSAGDKSDIYLGGGTTVKGIIAENIAFATVNYRYLESDTSLGVESSLKDGMRALQFIKYYAESLNIDKNKIILMGSSAGAGITLWTGLQNDQADSEAEDPVLRESTKAQGLVATETQASYDVLEWETLFASYSFDINTMASKIYELYKIDDLDDLTTVDEIVNYRARVNFLNFIDANDPELWVANQNIAETAPTNTNILYHHPYHAKALKDEAERVGLTSQFYIDGLNISDPRDEGYLEFIKRKLNN